MREKPTPPSVNLKTIELQEKNNLYRTPARGKICHRSESYVRDDRGRRLRDWPAHPPSPLMFYVRFLRIPRNFHWRGKVAEACIGSIRSRVFFT